MDSPSSSSRLADLLTNRVEERVGVSDLHPLREATANNLQRVEDVQEIKKSLKPGPRGL